MAISAGDEDIGNVIVTDKGKVCGIVSQADLARWATPEQTAMLGGPVAADRTSRYGDYAEPATFDRLREVLDAEREVSEPLGPKGADAVGGEDMIRAVSRARRTGQGGEEDQRERKPEDGSARGGSGSSPPGG